MRQNKRFVFFRETDAEGWPSGSLGFKVEPKRSLATDKSIFPRGGFVFVDTFVNGESFAQWMLDQDTGGAIRAPGRRLYLGGNRATALAGEQAEEGRGSTSSEGCPSLTAIGTQGLEALPRSIHALRGVDLQVERGNPGSSDRTAREEHLGQSAADHRPNCRFREFAGTTRRAPTDLGQVGFLPEHHRMPRYLTSRQAGVYARLLGITRTNAEQTK